MSLWLSLVIDIIYLFFENFSRLFKLRVQKYMYVFCYILHVRAIYMLFLLQFLHAFIAFKAYQEEDNVINTNKDMVVLFPGLFNICILHLDI